VSVVTRTAAQNIVKSIQDGEWTAVQVVQAFIKCAIRAQRETNAITEGMSPCNFFTSYLKRVQVMFKDALKEAEALDAEFAQTKQLRGPLHGLPVSFKDQCMRK